MISRITLRRFLFLSLILAANCILAQPWTQTKGPTGGFATDLIEHNGVILAGSLGGVYRTTDNGETWSHAMNGIPANYNITYFAQTTNFIYAAGNSEGLYRSSDDGLTWTAVPINLPSIFILELYTVGDTLYIGCEGAGVIRSVNGGAFEFVNSGFPASAFVVAFASADGYIFCGLSGNGGSVGVYRSPVNSINWTQVNTGLIQFPSVLDLAVDGTDLYMITQSNFDAGFFKSTDLGNTWFEPLADFDDFGGSLLSYQGALYTTPDAGFPRKSIDGGASWTIMGNGLKPLSAFSYLGTPAGLFLGCERGIMRSTDAGQNWQAKSKGFTNVSTTSLFSDGNRLYATCRTSNLGRSDGVFYSEDDGENWISMDKGLNPNPEVNAIVRSGDNIIIGTSSTGLYRKPDNSDTFTQVTDILTYNQINVLLSAGQYVLAGASGLGEMYRSTDYGLTWAQSNSGFRTDQEDQVYSLYNHNGVIFAGAFNALYRSIDFGATWTNSFTGLYPGSNVVGITSLGDELYVVGDNFAIYKSTDNGASWFSSGNGVAAINQFHAIVTDGAVLYAGGGGNIYRSTDNGATWAAFSENLPSNNNTLCLAIHSNKLFAGLDHTSVWKQGIPLATTGFNNSKNSLVIAPNPSNGILTIAFGATEGDTEISVFNALGQQVYHKASRLRAGSTQIDISSQPAGIYLLKVNTGGAFTTGKIIKN